MNLEYKITTTAELAGAEAAADALERQIGKAKALKQDYSGLEAQLKTMRGSIDEYKTATAAQTAAAEEEKRANEQLADSYHEVSRSEAEMAEKGEKAELSHRQMFRVAGELNRILPGLGELMMVAFEPVIAPLIILAGLFAGLVEHIKSVREEMAKMAEANIDVSRITDGTEAMEAQLDVMRESVGKADEFATATDHVADAQKRVTDETNHALDALRTQAQFEEEEAKAREKLALDQVRQKVATGQLTPAQGEAAEIDITSRNAREADRRKSALEAAEIAAREKEQAELKAQQFDLSQKKIKEAGSPEAAQTSAEEAKKLADKYQKDADAQVKYLQDFGKDMSPQEFTQQLAKLSQLQQLADQQAVVAGEAAEKAKAVKEEWEKTVGALKKVNDRLAELGEQIPQLESSHKSADKHRATMRGIEDQSTAINRVTGDIDRANKDVATINEISGHATQTQADAKRVADALKDAHAAVADAAATIGKLGDMGADVENLKKQVAQLRMAVDHH